MTSLRPTRYEMYTQAIEQLSVAVQALGQAHASMRDAGVDDIATRKGSYAGPVAAVKLRLSLDGLLAELKGADCDDCGLPLLLHGGVAGVLEPSTCKWGRAA